MKRRTFFALSLLLGSSVIFGCSNRVNEEKTNDEKENVNPESSVLKYEWSNPKKVYFKGEKVDLTGLKVFNSNAEEITNYSVFISDSKGSEVNSNYVLTEKGHFSFVIKSDGFDDLIVTDVIIEVKDNEMKMEISSLPLMTKYIIGEPFSSEGLVVIDENGNVISDYKLSINDGFVFDSLGFFNIEISKDNYLNKSFKVEVVESKSLIVESLEIQYKIGDTLDLSNVVVKDNYGQSVLGWTSSLPNGMVFDKAGKYTITFSYLECKSFSIDLEVFEKGYLTIKQHMSKITYKVGEELDISDLKICDDNGNEILDYEIYIDENLIINGHYLFNESGVYTLTIKKDGYKEVSFSITVLLNSEGAGVVSEPLKKEYQIGEEIDLKGLIVQNENKEIIDSYSLSVPKNFVFNRAGEITISVLLNNKEIGSFKVNVKEDAKLIIKIKPTKTVYEIGDKFSSDGLVVIDNEFNKISDFSIDLEENFEFSTTGKRVITVSKDGYKSATFEIEVIKNHAINDNVTLRFLNINDTHGSFKANGSELGMSRIGKYLKENKSNYSFIMSGGDMWQGGIESNRTHGLIMTEAMNIIGFDSMTIGNHEFDWGEYYIRENKKMMDFPLLGSNILYSKDNSHVDFLDNSVIFDRAGIRIGIIGGIEEGIGSSILGSIASNYSFPDPITYIKEESDKLRNEGCDVIIYNAHDMGVDGSGGNLIPGKFYEVVGISPITNKRYIDAMFFAHDHRVKYGYYKHVPFIEAGSNGKYVGEIQLKVTKQSDGSWAVSNNDSDNQTFTRTSAIISEGSLKEIDELPYKYYDLIGDPDEIIYNFSRSYTSDQFATVVCQALLWFINDKKEEFINTVRIATHNYAGVRSSVSKGIMRYSDFVKVCPFDNSLVIAKSTSTQVNRIKSHSSIAYYEDESVPFENGSCYIGTISYVAEKYTTLQSDLVYHQDYIIGDALYAYLKSGINSNL